MPTDGSKDGSKPDLSALEQRIGRAHLRRRLGLEQEHEVFTFGRPGAHFFYPENWYSVHGVIRHSLRLVGLYGRAQRNTRNIRLRQNRLELRGLPTALAGLRILHLSDLHTDLDRRITAAIAERVQGLDYDLCVLTGDYRARTFGPFDEALAGMASVRTQLKGPVYAVLGNHDSIRLVPGLEAMGIQVLLNEVAVIHRDGQSLYLAGIDDAHYYQVHNIDRVTALIPDGAAALLLSHTPEIYRHAAYAGFGAMLCGHTHGGQICLPGGIAMTWDARCPRRLAAGAWRHGDLVGYTSVGAGSSVVPARLNCPPEVTLHTLDSSA
ncbi:metallophosphoesterase [Thiohalocapsa marina]|uniref:Metallophosphoesterase n=1 Tax=Thiohalocapsa marina TaxID=424902 RepID=A0A5M8FPW6_9GAMM|nr:metallophosphoesterase [Thiohalocapsa marina]KAA6185171.1 metallophosphoesterase [Thiohalocapsa marina]